MKKTAQPLLLVLIDFGLEETADKTLTPEHRTKRITTTLANKSF
jgi:hypothetical protein